MSLNEQTDPPDAIAVLAQARAEVPPATVAVTSSIAGASLRVDGENFGPLPLTTKLLVGRHLLEAIAGGQSRATQSIVCRSGQPLTVLMSAAPLAMASSAEPLTPKPDFAGEPAVLTTPATAPAPRAASLMGKNGRRSTEWWGLIPIGVAVAGGWLGPPLFQGNESGYVVLGRLVNLAATALIGAGVGMIVRSSVASSASSGSRPEMRWWGLIPLGAGLAGAIATAATSSAPYGSEGAYANLVFSGVAIIGLGTGAGMLVGQAFGVSFFPMPGGGAAIALRARFD